MRALLLEMGDTRGWSVDDVRGGITDMASQAGGLICAQCRWANAPGVRYCANCGEPIDPALLAELQRLYTVLTELDAQVAAGVGSGTVESLRDTMRERYLTQRTPVRRAAPATPAAAPVAAPVAAPATVPLAQPAAARPMPTPQPQHGPVFSWRAFIAEQAIAVMAYLGGFLLLIATLTFEVGGWQALPDFAKLGGVLAVYIIFGVLGLALRRSTSLRTVSRVYLGVFALMTPLAALAVYRFELQARGFPIAGMVCIAAAYAAVVYLALAARTRFVTYAYLGWSALLLSALAIPSWAHLIRFWWIPITLVMAMLLLAPRALAQRLGAPTPAWLDSIEPSATQISAGAAILAAVATVVLGLQITGQGTQGATSDQQLAVFAAAACALILLSACWSLAARTFTAFTDQVALSALDWLVAASVALAAVAVAGWLHATLAAFSYTLTATALAEGLAAEALRRLVRSRVGLRIAVQVLAATLVGISMLLVAQEPLPDMPLVLASAVGVALGLLFALSGPLAGVFPWGMIAGVSLLIGAQDVFAATIPPALPESAFLQLSTADTLLTLALVALGLALRGAPFGSRLRRLRAPMEVTALLAALLTSVTLFTHTGSYSAVILGLLALAALAVARLERQPFLAGSCVVFFGSAATLAYINGNLDGVAVVALPIALALVTLALLRLLGRAYSVSVYLVTLVATLAAFLQLKSDPFETTAQFTFAALGPSAWMALVVALALTVDALASQSAWWMLAPAVVALLSVGDAHDLWPLVALTVALAGVGALLRQLRGPFWEVAWHCAALWASLVSLFWASYGAFASAERSLGLALFFALLVWLIAWQEQNPWLTALIAPYALLAFWMAGNLSLTATQRLIATFVIALAFTLAGMAARLRLGRAWALAFYGVAVLGAAFTASRVTPYPDRAGLLEALLLIFAALAFFAALLEETPWAALAPAAFAAIAALAQPDGRALLPLALGLAAAAFVVSRTRGAAWSLPLYGSAMVAAVATTWQSRAQAGGFEVIALVTLALAAWLLAALESRADALLVAFVFAALAVSAASRAFAWDAWEATLAFAALAWLFELSRSVWARIPWLRERTSEWLPALGSTEEEQAAWRDPRGAGQRIARGAAGLVAVGVVIGGLFAPQAFATMSAQTQAQAVALLSLALLLTRIGWGAGWRPALYLAGEAVALFVTWELRWLGATNVQAWIIAPGSAQLIIGALLPADRRLRPPAWVAQAFSVAGALILTLPTLSQSITEPIDWQWRYALLLAVEALALTLLAVGLRNRILALTGAAFVGVAAVRGAIIAVQQNLPVPIVIGIFALALMGLATWLSLRARRGAHTPTTP